MLTANLLPPDEKKSLKMEQYRRMIYFFGAGISALLLIGSILLVPSYVFLSLAEKNLIDEDAAETFLARKLKLNETLADAANAQALLTEVKTFLERPSRASQLIRILFADASGIRIRALSVTGRNEVTLSGFAATRDDLLNFQKQLIALNMLDTLTFPISDIIKSTDIQFTMTGRIKNGQGFY